LFDILRFSKERRKDKTTKVTKGTKEKPIVNLCVLCALCGEIQTLKYRTAEQGTAE
jgi:hypothetical protein